MPSHSVSRSRSGSRSPLSRSRSPSNSRSRSRNRSMGRNGSSANSRSNSRSVSRHRSRSSSAGSESDYYRLHIANLSEDVDRKELEEMFRKFGELKEVWMARVPPCFGFAVYRKKDNARAAAKATDGTSFCGQRIRVTSARPRTRGHRRRFYTGSMRCFQCGMTGHFYRDCKENGHSRHDGRDSRDNRDGRDGRHRTSRYSPPRRSGKHSSSSGRSSGRRSRRYSD